MWKRCFCKILKWYIKHEHQHQIQQINGTIKFSCNSFECIPITISKQFGCSFDDINRFKSQHFWNVHQCIVHVTINGEHLLELHSTNAKQNQNKSKTMRIEVWNSFSHQSSSQIGLLSCPLIIIIITFNKRAFNLFLCIIWRINDVLVLVVWCSKLGTRTYFIFDFQVFLVAVVPEWCDTCDKWQYSQMWTPEISQCKI